MPVTRTLNIDDLTPQELATLFGNMSDIEQAEFFSIVWDISLEWPFSQWCGQACNIVQRLDENGKKVILALAEHIQLREQG